MPETPLSRRATMAASAAARASLNINYRDRPPITAPQHGWLTSPARSHASGGGTDLPLHLIDLIINYVDNIADLARLTRTSRVFYYMALPRLYEDVTLRSYADIRYVNGHPEGFGNGSPFAMGLNTLVSRAFTDYVRHFRVLGETREHDTDDYSKGRVPDNSMMLQIAMRAAIDKMKNLASFAWELNTKPLQTIYQGIMAKPTLTSLTLRCQTRRIPRPTTLIPPLPNLITLVIYDIDPLCYPDDFSLLLLTAKKLENLKLHWHPRMRENGEESVNLINYFGRCLAAKHVIPIKRMAMYNLYARNSGEGFENVTNTNTVQEMTIFNCMGSTSDPMNVFLDNTWRVSSKVPVHPNMKMLRIDIIEKEHAIMLARFQGLERFYMVSSKSKHAKSSSMAATPTSPSTNSTPSALPCTASNGTTPLSEHECKSIAGDYLAVIQSNHRTMRHLLLPDNWQLSDEAMHKLLQSCPDLEQLGFACSVPPFETFRRIVSLTPKLFAIRHLIRPGSDFSERMDAADPDMHVFALATELWRPEYKNLKYVGIGKLVFKLGNVVFPPKSNGVSPGQGDTMNARRMGPVRRIEKLRLEDVQHIEIWGMDNSDFDPAFP